MCIRDRCWTDKASADNTHEIFIHPQVAEPIEAAAVLAHELTHAAVGLAAKHGKPFKRVVSAIGLIGRVTATPVSYTHLSAKTSNFGRSSDRWNVAEPPDPGGEDGASVWRLDGHLSEMAGLVHENAQPSNANSLDDQEEMVVLDGLDGQKHPLGCLLYTSRCV